MVRARFFVLVFFFLALLVPGRALAADSDGDGVDDLVDNCPSVANPTQINSDGDGFGDACDNCPFVSSPTLIDSDGDGFGDACDNCLTVVNQDQANNDGDGTGDVCDADDDNDGFPDTSDNCPFVPQINQNDNDLDGLGDPCDADDDNDGVVDVADNCKFIPNGPSATAIPGDIQNDNDLDDFGDPCDADDDNDGVLDFQVAGPYFPTFDPNVPFSPFDNCQYVANTLQLNNDAAAEGAAPTQFLGDACDIDDDNDGVLDTTDNCQFIPNGPNGSALPGDNQSNNDGDAMGDVCDTDDDNDGVFDYQVNPFYFPNFNPSQPFAPFDNCQFIPNGPSGFALPGDNQSNNDGDAMGNVCDTDDDNDGVFDYRVSPPYYPNFNPSVPFAPFDNCPLTPNGSPVAPGSPPYDFQLNKDSDDVGDACDDDDDGDSVLDVNDNCRLSINPLQEDYDNDLLGDSCDDDADNDGIHNALESLWGTDSFNADSDADTIDDAIEVCPNGMTCDPWDDDVDGTMDGLEVCVQDRLTMNTRCYIARAVDTDNNALPDAWKVCADDTPACFEPSIDTDGDGLDDAVVQCGVGDTCFLLSPIDTDGNGAPDSLETCGSPIGCQVSTPVDTDNDNTPDAIDEDSDGDDKGLTVWATHDIDEATDPAVFGFPVDTDGDGIPDYRDIDSDDDGILDEADNCPFLSNPSQEDILGNGFGDACDIDSDGDGVVNVDDNCPSDTNSDQFDVDNDLIGDACDNCPSVPNLGQFDIDNDLVGDACDNCLNVLNFSQSDIDNDLAGDACDNCPSVSNLSQFDTDSDIFGDACDNCPSVSNLSQFDTDGDTFGDACDNCPNAYNPSQDSSCIAGAECSTDDTCDSGYCAAGICCDEACTETCKGCTNDQNGGLGDGVCGFRPTTYELNATCVNGSYLTSRCDGEGNVLYSDVSSCDLYACDAETGCLVACMTSDDCSAKAWCSTSDGTCLVKQDLGVACSADEQCASDLCANGTCQESFQCVTAHDCSPGLVCDAAGRCVPPPDIDPGELSCGISMSPTRDAAPALLALGLAAAVLRRRGRRSLQI